MEKYYTDEKNIQILIALLKEHGVKKVIASPGGTNTAFIGNIQNDSFFEIYSSVDERSAAYMACGLSAESGEPVVLSCTGATASRNYMSGLTEAYYRKLPILAITSSQETSKLGHLSPQLTDRSSPPSDVVKYSVELSLVRDDNDWWSCEIKANNAILELRRHGGGPVHINLISKYRQAFETVGLPNVRVIKRITQSSDQPPMPKGRIAIVVGSHNKMDAEETKSIDKFCESNNAVVFCDHSSGYKGKYRVLHALSSSQRMSGFEGLRPDLSIHIGEITGDYYVGNIVGENVWRVSEDGEIRDTFCKLQFIFEMPENIFFDYYAKKNNITDSGSYLKECQERINQLNDKVPELPFSNIWMAQRLHKLVPENSVIHFAILNSLRSWNFFELPETVDSYSNVGGFGIDGCVSSLVGASLFNNNKLYFGVTGDLAFFYDINVMGNRHVGSNLRILLINNGLGTEFKNFDNAVANFGESTDLFIAAAGHFGNKSKVLVKNYCENLGFEYLSATNKKEFELVYERFLSNQLLDKPIVFEVFTNSADENRALEILTSINVSTKFKAKDTIKNSIKNILGADRVRNIKKIINK